MIDIFEETKARLTIQDVVQHYGFTPDRAGYIRCPFHQEKTASLKLYDNGSFFCFGCNTGGSVIDFVARLYGLTPLEAVKRLDADFHLALPIGRPLAPSERYKVEQAAQQRRDLSDTAKAYEAWRDSLLDKLTACFRLAHLTMNAIETPTDLDRLAEAQTQAIQWQATLEHWADCLLFGDMAVQMDIFRDRKGVEACCDRILNLMHPRSGVA